MISLPAFLKQRLELIKLSSLFSKKKKRAGEASWFCLLVLLRHFSVIQSTPLSRLETGVFLFSLNCCFSPSVGSSAVQEAQRLIPICSLSSKRSHWAARRRENLRSLRLDGCWSVKQEMTGSVSEGIIYITWSYFFQVNKPRKYHSYCSCMTCMSNPFKV